MLTFDHIALSATDLATGTAQVEQVLGQPLVAGGQHLAMGTHNRLAGMGDLYLEVIAIDSDLPAPMRPRWFDLDHFTGPVRLTNWVVRCDDLEAAIAACPPGVGRPMALTRGDLRWRMAVPDDGCLPFGGAFPALIEWQGPLHPTQRLPEQGLRLVGMEITHPEVPALRRALAGLIDDARIRITDGPAVALSATIDTPGGGRVRL